jgi:hypothetical protein
VTRDDQVLALLGEANPVRDPSGFAIDAATRARLEAVEQWSGPMEAMNVQSIERPPAGNRRSWMVAAAAAAIVLAGVGAWFVFARANADVAGHDTATFEGQVATVEAMVEARNSGDYDAWRAFLAPDRPEVFGEEIQNESQLDWQRSYMAANEVWTMIGACEEHRAPTGEITGIICPVTMVNDFFGPGGLFYTAEIDVRFDETGDITSLGVGMWNIDGDPQLYATDFDTWLRKAHPDVHASFGPRVQGQGGLPNADDMPTALAYVDEFLEQSVAYPLGG